MPPTTIESRAAFGGETGARALRVALDTELQALLAAWFPRCVDKERGGFFCDFDYRWRLRGRQDRGLEFQGRTTHLAGLLAQRDPTDGFYRETVEHGYRYLEDVMWDAEHGGWFRLVDRAGLPQEAATKHAHASAYAIDACVAHHRATADPSSLTRAKEAFAWLDAFSHDSVNGGYFGALSREGKPILSAAACPYGSHDRDVIGTPFGFKDANTMSDVLSALAGLYAVWPDAHLRERIEESFVLLRDRFITAPGTMHMFMSADWSPVPDFARFYQTLHSANHLREIAPLLGTPTYERTMPVVKSVVDTILHYGWDHARGGFYFGGSTFGPTYVADLRIMIEHKTWWGQAEGMTALLALAATYPNDERDYAKRFEELWAYVGGYLIDRRHGGWFPVALDSAPAGRKAAKASLWRDASHEANALLECGARLGLANGAHA